MAHFIYNGGDSADMTVAEKCYRIIEPKREEVWDHDASTKILTATSALTAYEDGNIPITYDEKMPGYPVTLPSTLPTGEYLLFFYNTAEATAVATDYEAGVSIKWDNNRQVLIGPPKAIFSDLYD